jgi:hypothetical protein
MNDKKRIVINKPAQHKCEICQHEFSLYSFSSHIKHTHQITSDEYASRYGEFRKPKKETSTRNIKKITCGICNGIYSSVGMHVHLRDTHNISDDDYCLKYGEYRPAKLRQLEYNNRLNNISEDEQCSCLVCDDKFASPNLLGHHIKSIHKLNRKDYIINHVFKGVLPKCKCGCGEYVKILLKGSQFAREYKSGHNQNPMTGKEHSPETKLKMSEKAVIRVSHHNSSKTDTYPELEFKLILDTLGIEYIHPYTVNLGTRFASVDFYIVGHHFLVEIDGEYWHPKELSNLNFQTLSSVISDGERRELKDLIRIRESDITHFKKYAETKELAIEYLVQFGNIFDPKYTYDQVFINMEYFQNRALKRGIEYLKSYVWLIKKFIRTFVLEMPMSDIEKDTTKILSGEDKNKLIQLWNDDNSMKEVITDIIGCGKYEHSKDLSLKNICDELIKRLYLFKLEQIHD